MGMAMPALTEKHKKLAALAGTWVGEETIHPSPWDPKGGTGNGRMDSRIDLDGFFLVTDYVQERGGQICYRGHGVYGWDAGAGRYTMHWFDSIGSPCPQPALGTWEGNVLRFEMADAMGHHRYVYTFEGEGRHTFKLEQSQDGKTWATFMEGRYRRK